MGHCLYNEIKVWKGHYIEKFLVYAERCTGQKLKNSLNRQRWRIFRSAFVSKLESAGVQHNFNVPILQQQNGVAERVNRTVKALVRAILHHKNRRKELWGEALHTVAYTGIREMIATLDFTQTLFEIWSGSVPNISHLRVFEWKSWKVVPGHKLKKLNEWDRAPIIVSYPDQSKRYCWKNWSFSVSGPYLCVWV